MNGEYYYNKTLRNSVALFGTLFNQIYVSRNGKNQSRVPIAYGPRQKFLQRVDQRPELPGDHGQIKLPRMSFQMEAPVYDPERQKNANNSHKLVSTVGGESVAARVWQPASYILPFELSIMTTNQDEAFQIIEQIIPHFKPSIGLRVKPVTGVDDIVDDIIIALQSITKQDDFEGDQNTQRVIIYTLTFDMRINIYGRIDQNVSVIKESIVTFKDYDDSENLVRISVAVNPESANEDDSYTIDVTCTYGDDIND
jgi:hypothetical protein